MLVRDRQHQRSDGIFCAERNDVTVGRHDVLPQRGRGLAVHVAPDLFVLFGHLLRIAVTEIARHYIDEGHARL